MAKNLLIGLFHEATPTADTLAQLRELGIPDDCVTVMSGIPYRPEWLGRPPVRGRVPMFALIGAGLGLVTAFVLTWGLWLLYPLNQGGQGITPVPPTLIILFEVTMLGTMWAAFVGLLLENRFPIFKSQLYDPRITEGHIGVLAEVDAELADKAEAILKANGAHHLQRVEEKYPLFARPGNLLDRLKARVTTLFGPDLLQRPFWLVVAVGIVVLLAVGAFIPYGIFPVAIPTQMEHQVSIGFQQGPRLAAPAAAVPVQGPVLIAGQPASTPYPATADSLQRGKVLYDLTCVVCHGASGDGNGRLSGFFVPKPADLTSARTQAFSDSQIFLVITQGFGAMPSLAENLDVQNRWDVINYVRSLKK